MSASDEAASAPRRTIVIRGQVADRYSLQPTQRRKASRSSVPIGARPERAALWAVLLGLALVVAAIASAHL